MLLGIVYHVAISFHTQADRWIVKDIGANSFIDAFLIYSHTFRMPLFFIIAGFFCALVIARKGKGALIKNRLKRIGLPFLIFGVLFIPAWMALVYYSYIHVEPTTEFVAAIMQGANSNQPPSLLELPIGHLWFLYYLIFYYLIYSLIQPILIKLFEKLSLFSGLALFTILIGAGLALAPSLNLEISGNFVIQDWAFVLYGLSFLAGGFMYSKRVQFELLESKSKLMAIISFFLLAPIFVGFTIADLEVSQLVQYVVNFAYAAMVVGMCFGLIGLANKLISSTSKTVRYLSDASYWLYIMHMPIIVYLQIRWYDWEINPVLKCMLILTIVMVPLLVMYHFLVRYSFIGTMLNGKKFRSGKLKQSTATA